MSNIFVLYGTTRKDGNSILLTEKVIEGINCTKLFLMDTKIEHITDMRHTPQGFSPNSPNDDYYDIIKSFLEHDILIFSTPLYWYGMSGIMKNFVDRWSQILRDPSLDFKSKLKTKKAYVIVTGGDNPRHEGLPLIQQFATIFKFVGIEFVDYIIGKGNKPGEIMEDKLALFHASVINEQLRGK